MTLLLFFSFQIFLFLLLIHERIMLSWKFPLGFLNPCSNPSLVIPNGFRTTVCSGVKMSLQLLEASFRTLHEVYLLVARLLYTFQLSNCPSQALSQIRDVTLQRYN